MNSRVLIAGAGQLGSRYLQGLSAIAVSLEIWVYDISQTSLQTASLRWNEVVGSSFHKVYFINKQQDLPDYFSLAIIATTADIRASLIEDLTKKIHVDYWVLEKVLGQNVDDLKKIELNIKNPLNVWVNTPRYQWGLYESIRNLYTGAEVLRAYINDFTGIASNSIHFIDFYCRWGAKKIQNIDTRYLDATWRVSKRKNFYEVDGMLIVNYFDGSRLILDTQAHNSNNGWHLSIDGENWIINESNGVALSDMGRSVSGSTPLQSQLTGPMVEKILSGGAPPNLPTLAESSYQHHFFLSALLNHWNSSMPIKSERLSIT